MRLRINIQQGGFKVDEMVEGETAEQVVASIQKRVASEMGFLKGAVVRAMSPLAFSQEVTRQYNRTMQQDAPLPQTCEDFLQFGIDRGFAARVDDGRKV